jgi:hypothetical protein
MTARSPALIREDHNPLMRFPFFFLRWMDYRCPHCGEVFRRDYLPGEVKLGNGEHTCPNCRQMIDDGSREWPELRSVDKLDFLFPALAKVLLGSILLCSVVVFIIAPRDQVNWLVAVAVMGAVLVAILSWFAVRCLSIRHSIHRFEAETGLKDSKLGGSKVQ